MNSQHLFQPFHLKSLELKNRIVMAPMTRSFSPGGVPTSEVTEYYRRRAEGEVGLIITEGTVVNRPAASSDPNIPHCYGEESLRGWKGVVDAVHTTGGKIAPQLWHMGVVAPNSSGWLPSTPFEGPSGLVTPGKIGGVVMTEKSITETINAFAQAAADAKQIGFDAVEIHGAHGYLIDQFFWHPTNQRTDEWGGETLAERSRFAIEIVRAVRQAVGQEFVISFRISQWKLQDYKAKLALTPAELEAWVLPLANAGVDIFHCSQRRFEDAEFADSDLNLAGWVKKLTNKPSITVGSIGLSGDFLAAFQGESSQPSNLDELLRRLDRGDFDLVAIGRQLITNAEWPKLIHEGHASKIVGFDKQALASLV